MTRIPTSPTSQHPDIGLWAERLTDVEFGGQPCVFLDRDGVIVEETHYLHRTEDVIPIPGIAAAIAALNRCRIPVVVVTNQAGIGRGRYGWDAFAAVQDFIRNELHRENATFDMVLACAYHGDGFGNYAIADHPWRKPHAGMLLEAARTLDINLSRSFIVGDKISDLVAGSAAGLPNGALVLTGYGAREFAEHRSALESWNAEGHFRVDIADTAGLAISDWLDRHQPA